MSLMYCPNCKINTITERSHFSFLLAFLLAFTGLGLIIYILYHLDKKKDRCIQCGVKCLLKQPDSNQNPMIEQVNKGTTPQLPFIPKELPVSEGHFCPNCGSSLGDRENIKYCALCGSGVE